MDGLPKRSMRMRSGGVFTWTTSAGRPVTESEIRISSTSRLSRRCRANTSLVEPPATLSEYCTLVRMAFSGNSRRIRTHVDGVPPLPAGAPAAWASASLKVVRPRENFEIRGKRRLVFDLGQRPRHGFQIGLGGMAGVQEVHLDIGLRHGWGGRRILGQQARSQQNRDAKRLQEYRFQLEFPHRWIVNDWAQRRVPCFQL